MKTNEPTPDSFLERLFLECERRGASDIHLAPGLPPYLRVQGALAPLPGVPAPDGPALSGAAAWLAAASGRPGAWPAARGSLDGACSSASGARYRFNVFRRQNPPGTAPGAPAVALRRLDDRFRSLAELGLPASLRDFCAFPHGLVIVTGPTGSGKSTTLATLVDEINRTRGGHIVTIEDPVEYVHRPVKALVNQRQVGTDAPDFLSALVNALREDPDVILVGEIRDPETIRTAVVAAETGHLVFATLHAGDCPGAIERFVAVFPSGEQDAVRRQLALVLRGVVAQRLVPAEDGSGTRVAVCEVMRVTPAVANLVASGRSAQLYTAIETGSAHGMQTMEQDLSRLVRLGKLSLRTARALARRPEAVAPAIQSGPP